MRTRSATSVLLDLWGAIASISSKKTTQGAHIRARLKISRIAFSLSPTYLLNNSGPFTAINAKLHYVQIALARRVLQHPGGPYNSIPLEGYTPNLEKASGCLRGHSITFRISYLTDSYPPISDHKTDGISISRSLSPDGLIYLRTVYRESFVIWSEPSPSLNTDFMSEIVKPLI